LTEATRQEPPADASVERLAALRSAAREDDPVLFVYGPGTDDAFVDSAYRVCGIEAALWKPCTPRASSGSGSTP
jgi:hypothetical protein